MSTERKSDENRSRNIGALRVHPKHSRCWTRLSRDRKHKRATCLLRYGVSSKSGKAQGRRKRPIASRIQRPIRRRRRPHHGQAEEYLSRLLKICGKATFLR